MTDVPTLRRSLGIFDLFTMGVGGVVGCGIFVLFATILGYAGIHTPLAFLMASIPNLTLAFSYAELASIYKTNATEYESIRDAFGDSTATISTYILLGYMFFNAVTVLLLAGHLLNNEQFKFHLCLLILIACSAINYFGIDLSKHISGFISVIIMVILVFLILVGSSSMKPSHVFTYPPMEERTGFWKASFLALFLFTGYDSVIKMTEEAKHPETDVPNGVIGSVAFSSAIYVLIALAVTGLPNWKSFGTVIAPLTHLSDSLLGNSAISSVVYGVGWFALLNAFFVASISITRFMYGLSKEEKLPAFLSTVHPEHQTPHKAILFVFVVMSILLFVEHGETTANISNVFCLLFMIVLHTAVIVLRQTQPELKRPFTIPGSIGDIPILPILGILSNLVYLGMWMIS